jgi:hypothetical protein
MVVTSLLLSTLRRALSSYSSPLADINISVPRIWVLQYPELVGVFLGLFRPPTERRCSVVVGPS